MVDESQTWVEDPSLLDSVVTKVEREFANEHALTKTYLRQYFARPISAYDRAAATPEERLVPMRQEGFNLMREQVDGAVALICRELRPSVTPVGADFDTQRGAETLTDFLDGVFEEVGFMAKAQAAWRDACLAPVGVLKWSVEPETGRVRCERCDPLYTFWHRDEGEDPVHFYEARAVPRVRLKALYPSLAGRLDSVAKWRKEEISGIEATGSPITDTVKVVEGWRVKVGDKPGRHVIACKDIVLLDEPWPLEFPPLVPFRWDTGFRGYAGVPLARTVSPYHDELNKLIRTIHESLRGAVPWLLVHADGIVDNITDVPFQKVTWDGPHKPEISAANPLPPQVFDHLERLRGACAAETRVSQQATSGMRPAGLNSAPAQREWIDLISATLKPNQGRWEDGWIQSAKVVVGLCSIASKSPVAWSRLSRGNVLDEIRFSKIKLKPEQYRVRYTITSGLSLTTSGRMEQLSQLKAEGAIDQAEYLRQLQPGLPDIEQAADRANAPRDLIETQISHALNDGIVDAVSPMQAEGLDDLIRTATREYQRAEVVGTYPDANLEALRRLIKAASSRKAAMTPPPAPPVPPQGAPQAVPPQAIPPNAGPQVTNG